jgi:hypothetical protein
MPTMADAIADVRRMTYGSMSEKINLVATSASAVVDEVSLELDVTGIQEGMILSSGLNVWYVKGASVNDRKVFVVPGIDNSPVGGVSVGDMVYVRPRMTDWYAFNLLNDEIRALSAPSNGLYQLKSWTADVDPTYQSYDVPDAASNLLSLHRVRYRLPGTPDVYVDLPSVAWRWHTGTDTNRVQLLRNIPVGTKVQFVYKAPFTAASSVTSDLVTDCGLADTMTDIPPLGVAMMLLQTTESRRVQVQTQGDARRAEEVPATANSNAASQLRRLYRERVQDEYARLTARLPIFMGR